MPGPWRTDRAPYLRDPMRAFADPAVDVVCFMSAAQMGKTELQFNVVGWNYDVRPRPVMYVTPTEKLARSLSRDRIDKMFHTVPGLQDKIDRRYNKPGSLERWINGARFGMSWAGSATELASHPCAIVLVDERSRMVNDISGEGDPVWIAMARVKNYIGSKVGVFSTPTTEGICPTFEWWISGTRHRYCWQCPGCGHWFPPELEHAHYPEKADYPTIRAEAHIRCPLCAHRIYDDDRAGLNQKYIPFSVDEAGTLHQLDENAEVKNSVASYWVTGFCSLFTTIGEIMEHYARAARDGNPGAVKSAVNTQCGELWKEPGEGATVDDMARCIVPAINDRDILLVTAGVDVQQNSLYYAVRGWGTHSTSWRLDSGQLHGPTEYDDVWIALNNVLSDEFAGRHVALALIDSGYNTAQVYEWCRRVQGWSPSKGQPRQEKPFRDFRVDESPTGRAMRTLIRWDICTDTWKTWLYTRIRWPEDQPGGWHITEDADEEYRRQVVNERVRVSRGRREWYRTGNRRNHFLDCEVLAAAAAHIRNVRTLRPARPDTVGAPVPAARGPAAGRPGVAPRRGL